jgi:hypothetical protein
VRGALAPPLAPRRQALRQAHHLHGGRGVVDRSAVLLLPGRTGVASLDDRSSCWGR